MVRPQIVITGCGVVNALGVNAGQFFTALRNGKGGLSAADAAGLTGEGARLAALLQAGSSSVQGSAGGLLGRVGDFGAATAIDASRRRRMPRLAQLAIVAAQQALHGDTFGEPQSSAAVSAAASAAESAVAFRGGAQGLTEFYGADRVGVAFGTALGALDLTVDFMAQYIAQGLAAASPAAFPYTVLNTPAALIAMELGLRGPNVTVNHRDLSATEAVATACDLLLCRRADAVLAGGGDELSQSLLHAYRSISALAVDRLAGPYDRRRNGLCPGEGAALFLLERHEDAKRRGATVLARIAGYGRGGDARSRIGWRTATDQADSEPQGAVAAVQAALRMAEVGATAIDCVLGGGNGTDLERLETDVLRRTLADAAGRVAVSSLLGRTGEWPTSAAARLAAGLFALREQALPACLCDQADAGAALPGLIRGGAAQPAAVGTVLLPSFAQGGGNLALILTQP